MACHNTHRIHSVFADFNRISGVLRVILMILAFTTHPNVEELHAQIGSPLTAMSVINVKDYGAVGDGVADDTTRIQAAIDTASSGITRGTLFFPPGVYRITNTLSVTNTIGMKIVGQGGSNNVYRPSTVNTLNHMSSVLLWDGAEGGTMLRLQGFTFGVIDGLSLWGRRADGFGSRAGIGILLAFTSGFGAGNFSIPRLDINNCAVGFQCGENEGDGNCADLHFGMTRAVGCDVAFKVVNNQGVNYTFDHMIANRCERAFYFERGGDLSCDFLFVTHVNTILVTGHPGSGNGLYKIGHVTVDGSAEDDRTIWYIQDNLGPARVIFNGGIIPAHRQVEGDAVFQLKPGAAVFVRNVIGLTPPGFDLDSVIASDGTTRTASIQIEQCQVPSDPATLVGNLTGTAPSFYRIADCIDWRGVPLANIDYQAAGGTNGDPPPPSPGDDLIAQWTFDEGSGVSTHDITNGGHEGALRNGARFTLDHVQGSHAVNLDGSNDYVDVGPVNLGDTFSIVLWAKLPSNHNNIQSLIANAPSGLSSDGFKLCVNSWSTQNQKVLFETGNGSSGSQAKTDAGVFPFDQWTHVAVVVNRAASSVAIYVNGVNETVVGTTANSFKVDVAVNIGQMTNGNFNFKGNIDDLRIYNRLLTDSEIQAQFNLGN